MSYSPEIDPRNKQGEEDEYIEDYNTNENCDETAER